MLAQDVQTLTEFSYKERLALFLGTDLPMALTGLPGRTELAQGLAQRAGLPASLSLAAVAQRVMQGGSRWEFTDYLTRQLETVGRSPQRVHHLVAQVPVQTIITTAYDTLLELAFQQAGVPVNRLVRDSDLAFVDPRRRTLIKLYGDLQQRDTLVVTEDDHYGLWRNRDKESLLDEVRSIMRQHAVLFIGYNLADPDFNLLWREVLDRMGRFAIGAYAVWPDVPAEERRVWEARQIRVIDADPLTVLEQLVGAQSSEPLADIPLPPVGRADDHPEHRPMDDSRRQHLLQLRQAHTRRLQVLEVQAAQFGIQTPPHIMTEMDDIRATIADIDRQLQAG